MSSVTIKKNSRENIQDFILNNISSHQHDIVKAAIAKFGVSRQAVLKHVNNLVNDDKIIAHGKTRDRYYKLKPQLNFTKDLNINKGLSSVKILENFSPHTEILPKNINEICHYALSVLVNNIKDHSKATFMSIKIFSTYDETHIIVNDNGLGIFKHIQNQFGLETKKISAIELAKGPVESTNKRSSGNDIKSLMMLFDSTIIDSSEISLEYNSKLNHWSLKESKQAKGTKIQLKIDTKSKKEIKTIFQEMFSKFTNKVHIPINLARINNEMLCSRDQAKMLMNNLNHHQKIVFDFSGIEIIGPSFADELVFLCKEIDNSIKIVCLKASKTVELIMNSALKRYS